MKPRIPFRQRAKAAAQKARQGIRTATQKVVAVAKHRTTKRITLVAGTLALAGAMWYYSRGRIESPLRFMKRPPVEYVEHVRKQFPRTFRAEALSLIARMNVNDAIIDRSGMKREDAFRIMHSPIGRALIWEGVLANGKSAAENENLTYYFGTSTRLGKGKNGFSQLEPDKQLGVMIYWGLNGSLLARVHAPRPGEQETIADVNTMSADLRVHKILTDASVMQGRVSLSEMVDVMENRTSVRELKEKHDW